MKTSVEKIIYSIMVIVSSIIFAEYSTSLVATTVQLRTYEKGILFTLYLVLGLVAFYYVIIRKMLFEKLIKGIISKYIIITSLILSFLVISVFGDKLISPIPQKVDLTITALGERTEQSMGNEVWITGITKGDEILDLEEISGQDGWYIKEGSLVGVTDKPTSIMISLYVDKAVSISFVKHNYSGKVKILQDEKETIVDLYDANGTTYTYTIEPSNEIQCFSLRVIGLFYLIFILVLLLLLYTARKCHGRYEVNLLQSGKILKYNRWDYFIVIILAMLTASIYDMPDKWKMEKNELILEVLPEKNEKALGYEIWVQSVDIDGKDILLKKHANETWIYQNDGRVVGTLNKGNELKIEMKPREMVNINLLKTLHGGKVQITWNGETTIYDLYSENNEVQRISYKPYPIDNIITLNDVVMLLICIVTYAVIYLIFLDKDTKNKILITCVMMGNLIAYGITALYGIVDIWEIVLVNILSVWIMYHVVVYLNRKQENVSKQIIWKPIYNLYNFLFVICVLVSFTFNVDLPNLTLIGKVVLILEAIIIGMIICRYVQGILLTKKSNCREYSKKEKKKLIIRSIIPISITSFIYYIGCYPGFMTSDSIDQWGQMLNGQYKDAHPVFHTLFNQLCTLIWKSPAAISLAQNIIFIVICGYAIKVLMDCKVSKKIIYLVIGVFILNPVYYLMNMSLWKDVMYSNMIFLYTLYMIKIVATDFEWLSEKKNLTMFILVNLGTLLFRHNGASVVVATAILSIIFFYKKWIKITTIYAFIGAIFIIIIGPIYSVFGIESSLLSGLSVEKLPYSGINYHNISYIILKNGDITIEEINKIGKIRDIDEMCSSYSKYHVLNMKSDESVVNTQYLKKHAEEYKRLYSSLAERNKRLILQNMFNLKSYMWQAMQPVGGYVNLAPVNVIYENEYGLEFNPINININKGITNYFKVSQHGQIIALVWRPIIQLLLIIFTGIIVIQKANMKQALIVAPVLGNWAGLLLSVNFQDFRYMYCVMLVFPVIIGMIFSDNKL